MYDDRVVTCDSCDRYVTGGWAPTGSPLNLTIQLAMMRAVARGVVFSWAVREERTVCVDKPWTRLDTAHSDMEIGNVKKYDWEVPYPLYFERDQAGNPSICSTWRSKMMQQYGLTHLDRVPVQDETDKGQTLNMQHEILKSHQLIMKRAQA
jgi:hypothetical protein